MLEIHDHGTLQNAKYTSWSSKDALYISCCCLHSKDNGKFNISVHVTDGICKVISFIYRIIEHGDCVIYISLVIHFIF